MALRTLQHEGDNPDAVRVLLSAPTGTAAFNIGGNTLHSAFLLTVASEASATGCQLPVNGIWH